MISITVPSGTVKTAVVYSNLHIGFIAVCFLLGTYAFLGVTFSAPLIVLAFCGAFGVYQLERGLHFAPEDAFNHPVRLAWIDTHRRYFRVSTIIAVGIGICVLPLLRPATLAVCSVLGLFSMAYMLPVLYNRRMKAIWFLKPLLISGGWVVGGVLLPLIEGGARMNVAAGMLAASRFFFVLPNALLADWPDREGDRLAGLQTAANVLPHQTLKIVSVSCLLISLAAGAAALYLKGAPPILYVDLAGPLLLLGCVALPLSETRWLYSFAIDVIVAWPVMTALANWVS
jgi:4-hydroxybenzoate polyprenyltransferase